MKGLPHKAVAGMPATARQSNREGKQTMKKKIQALLAVAVVGVLAMGLALLSSGVYRSTTAESDRNFTRRTALSYLVNQIRQADGTGRVAVGTFGGSDALALTEHLDGTEYVTILYCLDGQLRELYTEAGSGLLPEDGIPVLELQSLTLSSEDGLLTLTVTAPNGERATVSLSPRCGLREEVGAL